MNNEIIVVTGNIGSGKSFLVDRIKDLANENDVKVDYFNFDDFTKELYQNQEVQNYLLTMFGTLDKTKISDIVFSTPSMLEALNNFFFAFVEHKFIELVDGKKHHPLVIEFPMYFEMKERSTEMQLNRHKVKVITVICSDEARINRVMARDNTSREKVEQIVASQLPQEYKMTHADYVVDTSKSDAKSLTELLTTKFKKVFKHAS
jgi:dephospho-CoA kinase